MAGARGLLINITGGEDMTLFEVDQAANRIREEVAEDANIIFGSAIDENLSGRVRVSVVATGIDLGSQIEAQRPRLVAVGGGGQPAAAVAQPTATGPDRPDAVGRRLCDADVGAALLTPRPAPVEHSYAAQPDAAAGRRRAAAWPRPTCRRRPCRARPARTAAPSSPSRATRWRPARAATRAPPRRPRRGRCSAS